MCLTLGVEYVVTNLYILGHALVVSVTPRVMTILLVDQSSKELLVAFLLTPNYSKLSSFKLQTNIKNIEKIITMNIH